MVTLCPTKIWARSVQPFWRLLDTNKQTPKQTDKPNLFIEDGFNFDILLFKFQFTSPVRIILLWMIHLIIHALVSFIINKRGISFWWSFHNGLGCSFVILQNLICSWLTKLSKQIQSLFLRQQIVLLFVFLSLTYKHIFS